MNVFTVLLGVQCSGACNVLVIYTLVIRFVLFVSEAGGANSTIFFPMPSQNRNQSTGDITRNAISIGHQESEPLYR